MVEFLITAEEAYPAFERTVLNAQSEVLIAMRIFDPDTRLVGDEARRIGDTWADIIAHKLDQGVSFDIALADFDPVARPALHRYAWECLDGLHAAGSAHPGRLTARAHLHPARVGWIHRLALHKVSLGKLRAECDRLNALPRQQRAAELARMPAFRALVRDGRGGLAPRLWPPAPLVPCSHHQKMAVIDRRWLYLGGLDLNDRRYDTQEHDQPADQTWHDVQMLIEGAPALAAHTHIRHFLRWTEGQPPAPTPGLLRTLSARQERSLAGIAPREVLNEIETETLALIAGAQRFLYIETQFLRSSAISQALARAGRDRPGLQLIVVLPAAPDDVAFEGSEELDARYGEQLQAEAFDTLREAFGDRFFAAAPAEPRACADTDRSTLHGAPIIYIHAKVTLADGDRAIVSSANLNGRSLRWDTETGMALHGADAARLFARCLDHWFRGAPPQDMTQAAHWRQAALANRALPPAHRGHFILPYDPNPGKEIGTNLPGVPEELV
ncbi:MAG: phospholipase [Roseivivax sp.]|nr:phospholipase [Roseivivax sp.]